MKTKELRIAEPCPVDWASMTPADRGRFCGECKKVVRDLRTMTETEAREMLQSAPNGGLCVRYVFDEHGKVFFKPDVPATFLVRANRAAAVAALALTGCHASPFEDDPGTVMGDVAYMPEQQNQNFDDAGPEASPDAQPDAAAPDASDDAEPDSGPRL